MTSNHTDLHAASPIPNITPSSLPISNVPVSFVRSSLTISTFNHLLYNSTTGKISIRSTTVGNSGGVLAGAVIFCFVFLLGLPGNLFTIWSILVRTRCRSVTTILILNLACADGFLMLLLPFFFLYLVNHSWIFTLELCKILYYLCCTNMFASVFLITLMSLHRLVVIVWWRHAGVLTDRRKISWMLVGLWIVALGLSVPGLVFRTTYKSEEEPQRVVCTCKHLLTRDILLHNCLETVLGFVLPYSVIIGSYGCILRKMRKTRFRRHIHSEKLILVIVFSFGLFWLPYHITNMVQVAAALFPKDSPTKARLEEIFTSFRALTSAVAYVSSCINPILYFYAGKSFIQREGLAFMARLFEATGLESTRKIRQSCRTWGRREGLRDKESDSTITINTRSDIKVVSQKNGK